MVYLTLDIKPRFILGLYSWGINVLFDEEKLKWNQFASISFKQTFLEEKFIVRKEVCSSSSKTLCIGHGQIEVIVIEVVWDIKAVLYFVICDCRVTIVPSYHGEFIIVLSLEFQVLLILLNVNLASPRAKWSHAKLDRSLIEKGQMTRLLHVFSAHLDPELDWGAVRAGHYLGVESYTHLLYEIVVEVF